MCIEIKYGLFKVKAPKGFFDEMFAVITSPFCSCPATWPPAALYFKSFSL
jgi:hypothetical protein